MERIGLILGADAGQFEREMNKAAQATSKLDRMMEQAGKKKFLSPKDAKEYDRAIKDVDKSLKYLVDDYRRITSEVERMKKAQQDQLAIGRQVTASQREELATLQAIQRARGAAIEAQRRDFSAAQQSRQGNGQGSQGFIGGFAQGFGGAMFPRGAALRQAYAQGGFSAMGKPGGMMVAQAIMSGFGWAKGQMDQGYATLLQNQIASTQLRQALGGSSYLNPALRAYGREGLRMGFSRAETLQQGLSYAQATGGSMSGFPSALHLQRAYSMNPAALTGLLSASRAAGGEDAKEINLALVAALKMGGFQRALAGELAQASTGLVASLAGQSGSLSTGRTMALVASMSRALGGLYMKSPNSTARLLSQLNQGIISPGGGEAGQSFMLRAMGLGTERGVGYSEAVRRSEAMPLAERIQRVLRQLKTEYGGVDKGEQALLLKRLFNIRMDAADRLAGLDDSSLSGINAALEQGQDGVNTKALGAQGARGLGLLRRENYTREAQAGARGAADKAYAAATRMQVGVLQKLTGAIEKLSGIVEKVLSYLPAWLGGTGGKKPETKKPKGGLPG